MPANVVHNAEQEKLWNKAKSQAEKQGRGGDYAYIMGIFKKMGGMEKSDNAIGLLVGKQLRPLTEEDLEKAARGEKIQTEAPVKPEEKLEKSFADEQWAMKFSGYRDLYIQALEAVKARMQLAEDQANARKTQKPWREVEEMPKSERDAYRKELDKERQKFDERYDKIDATTSDLDRQYIERRITEAKAMNKSEGIDGLGDYLEKSEQQVIAIGKKGGKIVGYDSQGKPIYETAGGKQETLSAPEPAAGETKAEKVSLDLAAKLLDAAIQKQDLKATNMALKAMLELSQQKGNKGKVMSELRSQLSSARKVAKTMVGRAESDRRKPPKGREPWGVEHVVRARSIRDNIDATRAKVAESGKSDETKKKQASSSARKSISYRQKKLEDATKRIRDLFEAKDERTKQYARILAPGAVRDAIDLHKEMADLHEELGEKSKVAEHKHMQTIAQAALQAIKDKDKEKTTGLLRQLAGLEEVKVPETKLAEQHGQLRLFKGATMEGIGALDEYLQKSDDGKPGKSLGETSTEELQATLKKLKPTDPGAQKRISAIQAELKKRGGGEKNKQETNMEKALPGKLTEQGKKKKEVLTGGASHTPPKEYREGGATKGKDYADPKNYKYPIDTEEHVRAAISYFSKPKNAGVYSTEEQKSIWGRIKSAAKKFKIELSPESGPSSVEKKGDMKKCAMKKSEGLDAMDEYLAKAVGSDESGGKAPPQSMPTGNPPQSMPTSSGVETNNATEGGPVEGTGSPGSSRPQPPSHQSQIGKVDVAKTEVLSADDATVAKYVESGYMGEGMKKSDMAQRHQFTPQELERTVAQRRAVAESKLRKGEEDLVLHPYSRRAFEGTDKRVEELSKSDFYQGVSPTMAPPTAVVGQGVLCKSCGSKHSAMLTSCPMCGDNCTAPGIHNGRSGSVILEKSIQTPGLQRKREEDLIIG